MSTQKEVLEALNWRYATKSFDPNKKLTQEQLDFLLEAIRLAPSSFGIQPWEFIVVTNPEIRAKLKDASYGQAQVTEASHLIVFAIKKNIDSPFVDNFIKSVANTRGTTVDSLKGYSDGIKGAVSSRTPDGVKEWSARQVYIALGVLLLAAAEVGIDAGPMEGFDPQKFDEILSLEKLGLESKVIAVVGFRKEGDPYSLEKKVRFPKEEVILEVK